MKRYKIIKTIKTEISLERIYDVNGVPMFIGGNTFTKYEEEKL